MQVAKRSMNWMPRASMYNEMAALKAKRQTMNSAYVSNTANQASAFSSISTSLSSGLAELTAKVTAIRVQTEAVMKIKKLA